MLTRPTGKQQSCFPQPKQVFGVGKRELEGTWRQHLNDYQQEGMHISPSESDHAEDEAQLHRLIPEGDDEVECLDEGRRALSCHADQGKVHTYRVKIVQSMCEAGDDILPCLDLHLLAT